MSITNQRKQELIKGYSTNDNDTGSVEVQCAILTERINNLTHHMKENRKDFSSRRGLLILVGRRRKLLTYIKRSSVSRYNNLIERLGIRK